MKHYDYLVIGGGVIGTSIARALQQRKVGKVGLLEKEERIGLHASGRNSGVIHSGINQKPGTLKARFCLEGSRRLREYCREHRIPMEECGTLVTARNPKELATLEKLLEMAREVGVPGVTLITGDELCKREPDAVGVAALFSPSGATVDSPALMAALGEETVRLGCDFLMTREVRGIEGKKVITAEETFEAGHIVNAAGLYTDRIAHLMGVGKDYRIIPFRGEYMEVKNCGVRTMIYQPPDLRFPFLSVHLTRETDGKIIAGPTATLALGREAYDKEWKWPEIFEMAGSPNFWRLLVRPEFLNLCAKNVMISLSSYCFAREIQTLVPSIRLKDLTPYRSGIRAQMVDSEGRFVNDLKVERGPFSTHVLNAVSPGMTSSLAFADYVVDDFILKTA